MSLPRRLFSVSLHSLLTTLLLVGPFVADAQAPSHSATPQTPTPRAAENAPGLYPSGNVSTSEKLGSCFDYYQFGSVTMAFGADLASVAAGAPFAVHAYIENTNEYPIVDATAYARIFKDPANDAKNVNGSDVVAYFPIATHFNLKPHEKKQLTFEWKVPADADPGNYRMVGFIVQDDRFNFLGLTFTDDVTGPPYNFKIVNDTKGAVVFDRTSATLIGHPYHFAAFSPTLDPNVKDVPLRVDVANSKNDPYIGTIVWKLYTWDGVRPQAQLSERTDKFALGAHASTTVTYTVTDMDHPVYYVTAELTTRSGSHSIAAFRFVRSSVNAPRLAAVEALRYPLTSGSLAFACVHSSGSNFSDKVHLNLSVKTLPLFGFFTLPIASKNYDGVIPGKLVALTLPIKQRLESFQVVATLSQNGMVIDQVSTPYDCTVLAKCTDWLTPVLTILGLLIAGFLVWFMRRRKHRMTHYTVSGHRSLVPPPQP